MKAIDFIHDKGFGAVRDLTGKAFSTAKDKIISLVRNSKSFQRKKPVVLPSTTVMPASVSKVINNAVEQKLASLVTSPMSSGNASVSNATSSAIMNAIAGSGLGNPKGFQRKGRR